MKKKQRIRRTNRITFIVLLLIIAAIAVSSFRHSDKNRDGSDQSGEEVSYTDYDGKKIGILTGTNMEAESFKYFPDSEYFYYDGYPNLNAALLGGKIDAYLGDEPALKSIHSEEPKIDYIKERLTHNKYSFAFRKDDPAEKKLCDEFNEFLRKLKEDGTYEKIDQIWFGADDDQKVVDLTDLTGKNGTIHVVTTSTDEPFSYIKDGKNVGYDIDVVARFCREKGYALELGEVDFSARIPALASGRYEFTTSMNVTPEREESVLFSDPVSEGGIVVAVRSEDLAQGTDQEAGQGGAGSADQDGEEEHRGRRHFPRNKVGPEGRREGADAHEARVPEGKLPGDPDHQVQADRGDGIGAERHQQALQEGADVPAGKQDLHDHIGGDHHPVGDHVIDKGIAFFPFHGVLTLSP